jgi:hypothetical protein
MGGKMTRGAVISLCDFTGNMCVPWSEAGYECWCFDIQHSIRRPRREGNINFVWGDVRTIRRPTRQPIVFGIAQTPCTNTAVSGARDFEIKGGHMLVDAIVLFEAARQVLEWAGCPYMMENPVSMLSTIPHIGRPDYYFHPADYTGFELGDNYTKKTSIWCGGGFVMPPPYTAAVDAPDNRIHFASPGADRANIRSAAPMGFARAVFQANAPHLKARTAA